MSEVEPVSKPLKLADGNVIPGGLKQVRELGVGLRADGLQAGAMLEELLFRELIQQGGARREILFDGCLQSVRGLDGGLNENVIVEHPKLQLHIAPNNIPQLLLGPKRVIGRGGEYLAQQLDERIVPRVIPSDLIGDVDRTVLLVRIEGESGKDCLIPGRNLNGAVRGEGSIVMEHWDRGRSLQKLDALMNSGC